MPSPEVIHTASAPEAIGPYSQAVRAGNLLFCSGQIALHPGTGQLVQGGVAVQAEQVMRNLVAVLQAAGAGPAQVVKTTIYLTDLGDFVAVNEIYGRFFGDSRPARATVQVAALPRGAAVEVDAVAVLPV